MSSSSSSENEEIRYYFHFPETTVALGADRQRHGIVSMQTARSSCNLIREPYYGLNVYRLMSSGKLMAIARSEPFQMTESTGNRLALSWEATDEHPVKLAASYDIVDQSIIDFTLSLESLQTLQNYEISICSYFDFSMEPYTIISEWPDKTDVTDLQLLKVEDHPYIKGYYVCFPRDSKTAHMRTDGRWRDQSTGQMIAHHVLGPYYGRPIAIMANPDEYIVQMADSRHCNAVDTTYSSSDKTDSIMLHNALYFNMFGENLQAGDRRTARIRQVLCRGEVNLNTVLGLYDQFAATL